MSLFITSLNSGSNGNCYYVGTEHEAVLIDAGLSCRQTETRMERLGLLLQTVKAIFVSHGHSDHISGIARLAKKCWLPVYITPDTLQKLWLLMACFRFAHCVVMSKSGLVNSALQLSINCTTHSIPMVF